MIYNPFLNRFHATAGLRFHKSLNSNDDTRICNRRIWHRLFIGLRSVELTLIFLPALILLPVRKLNNRYDAWWNSIFTNALISAGPIFIKLGQWMSTRRDIFDESLIHKLSTLTSDSKSHPFSESKRQISSLISLDEFLFIDPVPVGSEFSLIVIGSGAIAQVHLGRLKSDEIVAIKVLHPNIHDQLQADLRFLSWIGQIGQLIPAFKTFDIEQELLGFSQMMKQQSDLRIEHENLSKFNQNFSNIDQIQFPKPLKSNQNVLIETFAHGIHLKQIMNLKCAPFNDEIVHLGLKTIVKMILKDNFLHADLHPGNILVSFVNQSKRGDKSIATDFYKTFERCEPLKRVELLKSVKLEGYTPNLVVLDAGLVTQLSKKQYSALVDITNAALESDAHRVAEIFVSESKNPAGVIEQDTLASKLEQLMDGLTLEESGALLFSKLDAVKIVGSFIDLVRDHNLSLYGEYIGLLVSCLTVEGIGRTMVQNDFDMLPILSEAACHD